MPDPAGSSAEVSDFGSFHSAADELRRPLEPLAREFSVLRASTNSREHQQRIDDLLETVLGETPVDSVTMVADCQVGEDPSGRSAPFGPTGERYYLERLLAHLPQLHERYEPARYRPAHHGPGQLIAFREITNQNFATPNEMHEHWYFGRALPPCADDYNSSGKSTGGANGHLNPQDGPDDIMGHLNGRRRDVLIGEGPAVQPSRTPIGHVTLRPVGNSRSSLPDGLRCI